MIKPSVAMPQFSNQDLSKFRKDQSEAQIMSVNLNSFNGEVVIQMTVLQAYFSMQQNNNEQDKFQNGITKGGKKHHISFRDRIEQPKGLKDVHVVENWSKYNQDEDPSLNCCKCCLLM